MVTSYLVSKVQNAAGGIMLWEIFSLYTLGPLVTAPQSIWMLLLTMSILLWPQCIFCHDTKFQSSQTAFLNVAVFKTQFTLLKWPPQQPDPNLVEHR